VDEPLPEPLVALVKRVLDAEPRVTV